MSATPRVTVAIPTRNRADLLALAIRSVLEQSMSDFELFVSDNASTDHTRDAVASFGDERITYLPLDENIGLHGNANRCLELGTAPFLTILQDDDYMLSGNLEQKSRVLDERPDVALVHSAFRLVDAVGATIEARANWAGFDQDLTEAGSDFIARTVAQDSPVNISSSMMRRAAVGDLRFNVADGTSHELGFWLRLAQCGQVSFLAGPLVAVRRHDDSASVQLGSHSLATGVYKSTVHHIAQTHAVKERFLDEHGPALGDRGALRSQSAGWTRRNLLWTVKRGSEPERRLTDTLRLLRQAAGVDRGVLTTAAAAQLVAAAALGERGRRLARRLRTGAAARPHA